MAKPWSEVVASDAFQALSPGDQELARQQYFRDVVAPRADASELGDVRKQFDAATAPYHPNDTAGPMMRTKDLRLAADGTVDVTQFPPGAPARSAFAGKTPDEVNQIRSAIAANANFVDPAKAVPEPSPVERVGAGLNDVLVQAPQWLANKVTGDTGAEADRMAARTRDDSLYRQGFANGYGTPDNPTGGLDGLRMTGQGIATLPAGAVVGAPLRALGAGAEALGLGTTAAAGEATGLAGALGTAGNAIASSGGTIAAGKVLPTLAFRSLAAAPAGALAGGAIGAADNQAGTGALTGAAGAAIASPVLSAVGAGARGLYGTVRNALSGDTGSTLADAASTLADKARGVPSAVPQQAQEAALDHVAQMGPLTPEAQSAAAQEAASHVMAGAPIDPAAVDRAARFAALGIKPSNAMVSRDPYAWANESDIIKDPATGAPLLSTYQGAKEGIKTALQTHADAQGGALAGDAQTQDYDLGNMITGAVQKKFADTGKAVSSAYNQVRDQLGDNAGLIPDSVKKAASDLSDIVPARPWVDTVTNMIAKFQKEAAPEGATAEQVANSPITVNQAESIRKMIGGLGDGSPTAKHFQNVMKSAVENDVIGTAGDDAFKDARAMAADRFNHFGGPMAQKIINGDVTPETIFSKAVQSKSGSIDDLQAMKDILTKNSPDGGADAMKALQQRTGNWLLEQATRGKPDAPVTYEALKNAANQLGDKKMAIIFGPEGAKNLRSIQAAAQDALTVPDMAAVNFSNTAAGINRTTVPTVKGFLQSPVGQATSGVLNSTLDSVPVVGGLYRGARAAAGTLREQAAANAAKQAAVEATQGSAASTVAGKAAAQKAAQDAARRAASKVQPGQNPSLRALLLPFASSAASQ